ncbi:hypothetical protein N2152v2_002620 [Parachlorella kessleri]
MAKLSRALTPSGALAASHAATPGALRALGYLRRQLLLLAGGAIAASTVGYSLVGSGILEGRPVSEDDASSLKQLEAYFERGVRLVDPRGEAQLELVAPSARDEYYVRLDPSRPDRLLLKPKGGAGVYYLDIAVPVNAQVLLEVFQKPPSVFEKAEWEQRLRPLTPQQLPSQEWPLIPGQPPRTIIAGLELHCNGRFDSPPSLVYEEHLKQLDLSGARRQQDKMNAGGGSRVAFNWLSACAMKDTWRSLVG